MKTVIMAGGRGTRISAMTSDIPKSLIKVDGIPILEREIVCLRDQGFTDIIITVSHMANQVIDYFSGGQKLGVNIEYFVEEQPLGNAGALFKIRRKLTEDFLLINADVLFDIDIHRFISYHRNKSGLVTLFTHPNNHPYDSGVIVADENGAVKSWFTKEEERPKWYRNRVNAGLHVINPKILDMVEIDSDMVGTKVEGEIVKIDLDRQILRPLCGTGQMFCYDSPEYVKDMGTPERFKAVCRDVKDGITGGRNLKRKQKAIFLDRDGTINKHVGFLRNIDEFELLPGVSDAIKKINASGYLAIVITNQPVVARGELTREELQMIHDKMETLLGTDGAYLDAIYYCPHHPHKGYKDEILELKVDCDCRKPKPGMIFRAAEDFNIDLINSWMIGDSENDIKAGKAAGCKTALIGKKNFEQSITVSTLIDFVETILK